MATPNTERPEIASVLSQTRFINDPALEMYFAEYVGECEFLHRDGDEFARIDVHEIDAGKKVVERLAHLRQRERERPVHVDHSEAIRFKNYQREWNTFLSRREKVREMLNYQQVDALVLEFVDIELRMIGDGAIHDKNGLPPATWKSDSEALGRGIAELENMKPAQRQQIPQMLNQRRLERRVEALESSVEAIKQWATKVGAHLSQEKAA